MGVNSGLTAWVFVKLISGGLLVAGRFCWFWVVYSRQTTG